MNYESVMNNLDLIKDDMIKRSSLYKNEFRNLQQFADNLRQEQKEQQRRKDIKN